MDKVIDIRDTDYRESEIKEIKLRILELENKTSENSIKIKELKINYKNIAESLNKNNIVTESINLQNAKFSVMLDTVNNNIMKTSIDIKEMYGKLNKIEIDSSKNTDNRLTIKQILVSLFVSILMLLIGAGLALSGINK